METKKTLNKFLRDLCAETEAHAMDVLRKHAMDVLRQYANDSKLYNYDSATANNLLDKLIKISDGCKLLWTTTEPTKKDNGKDVPNYRKQTIRINSDTYYCKSNESSNYSEIFSSICSALSLYKAVNDTDKKDFPTFQVWMDAKEKALTACGLFGEAEVKSMVAKSATLDAYNKEKSAYDRENINGYLALVKTLEDSKIIAKENKGK